MKPPAASPLHSFSIVATAVLALTLPSLHAASSTWTGLGNQAVGTGIWGGVANWVGSSPADGAGFTATFGNSFNNGYACTVNTNRTIGNIVYNDPANANNFALNKHASNFILTLNNSGASPVIDVKQAGRTLTINPITAGTAGLTKIGPGTLVLTSENTLSGSIRINAGILALGNSLALQSGVLDTANSIAGDADNGLRTTVTPISLGGLAGNKDLAAVFTTTTGGFDTVGDLTLNPGAGVSASYSGIIPNGAPAMSVTKIGEGTQTLAGANTYTGVTTITAGTLNFSTAGSATSNVIVSEAATHGVVVASAGGQWATTGDLNYGNNSAVQIDFGSAAPSTTTAPVKAANVTTAAAVVVRLAATSFGGLAVGQSYPLMTWTGTGPANAAAFFPVLPHRLVGNLTVTGKTLMLNVTANAVGPISWNTGTGTWDTVAANWLDALAAPASFFDSLDSVLFGDAVNVTGNPVITLGTTLSPVAVTMKSTSHDYTLSGANGITGNASLTLDAANTRTLTLSTPNTYTGPTVVGGGTLKLGALEVIPDGPGLGNVTVDGVLDLNTFSETINGLNGSGTVDNKGPSGLPTFAVGGNNAAGTFSGVIRNTGDPVLFSKTGTGRQILSGANLYTGGTTILAGTLQLGTGGTTGSLGSGPISNFGTLEINRSDALTIAEEINGTGGLVKNGAGKLTLTSPNTYTGATTVSAGELELKDWGASTMGIVTVAGATGPILSLSGPSTFSIATRMFVGSTTNGTVNQSGGTLSFTASDALLIGNGTGSTGTYNLSGGTINTTYTSATRGVMLGVNPGNTGIFNLSGTGELNLSTAILHVGRSDAASANTTTRFNQTGGTATIGTLTVGGTGAGNTNSTLTLTGGTFTAAAFTKLALATNDVATINIGGTADVTLPAFPTTRGTGASATLNFDGGTLKPAAESAAWLGGLTNAFIKAGGAKFDTTLASVTITQPLLADGVSTGGGLTKLGSNTLTLAGANTYTGITAVNAGTLACSTTGSATSTVTVAAGATHAIKLAANGGQWVNTGDLTPATGSEVLIDYGATTPSTTVAPVKVGNLAPGTGVALRVAASSLAGFVAGQSFPLITWTGTGPVNGSAFNLTLPHRVLGNLSVSANTLTLNVTGNAGPLSWNTGSAAWNTSSANWVDAVLAPATFVDPLDAVVFGDATGAAGNPVITLGATLSPLTVTMKSTARDYTLTGTGAISGPTPLTLDAANTRTLTLGTPNTYTGGTVIQGGTLKLGAADVIPDGTGAGSVTVGGTLDLNGFAETINGLTGAGTVDNTAAAGAAILTVGGDNASSTFGGIIRNNAAALQLAKTGSGTLTLTGSNTYTGGTTINGGTLQIGSGGTTGSPGTGAVTNNGTLDFNRSDALTVPDVISGTGALRNSGTGTVTLSGENTVTGAITVSAGRLNLTTWGIDSPLGLTTVSGASGAILGFSGNAAFSVAPRMLVGASGSGTVNQTGGVVAFTAGDALLLGNGTAGTGTYNLSGGTLTSYASTTRGVMLGVNAGCTGIFNLSGTGDLNMPDGILQVGRSDSSVANGTGTFNQTGGTATVGTLALGGNGATGGSTVATLNLTAGTFTAASFPRLGLGISDTVVINIGGSADVTLPAFPTGRGFGTNTVTLNLNGGTLKPVTATAPWVGGLTNAFIKAGGARFDTTNGDASITQDLLTDPVSTGGGLTKAGPGILTLTGTNTYSGSTTVLEGTLALGAINANNEASTVTLAAPGAMLQLNYTGSDTVSRLITGSTQRAAGIYGHTDSGANNGGLGLGALDAWFAPGTGTLTITSSPVAGGYTAWAAINAPTGTPADDFDGDGVANGVEFVLGGDRNTNDAGKLPQLSTNGGNMVFTFVRDQASIGASTTVGIEVGTALSVWPTTFPVPDGAAANNPGVTVVKNAPSAGRDTVTLTIPQAPDADKFARLKVTVTP